MDVEVSPETLRTERLRQRIRFAVDAVDTVPDYMRKTLRNQRIMIGLVGLLTVVQTTRLIMHLVHLH